MKIYTKGGDAGQTSLFGGERVSKNAPRVRAYGEVDELNSVLGVAASEIDDAAAAKASPHPARCFPGFVELFAR